jgi:hypothetical protein
MLKINWPANTQAIEKPLKTSKLNMLVPHLRGNSPSI